ncbi:MAG: PQQ-binding-like beta-propeller repeat protein [Planctomycetes bacterium]|nr:PQQ-binding-like beta-propeller repeat protein [Planctomycetota bacterium]
MDLSQLVFVGFNSRVAALDRDTGALVWNWKSRRGSGYTTVLLDGDRLIVSVVGYTYCLDARTGDELWLNELPGMGSGVASLASVRGVALPTIAAAEQEQQRRGSSSSSANPALH